MHWSLRYGYLLLAAVSGGITAQTFKKKWQALGAIENVIGVFVSASFSIFVAPFVTRAIAHMFGTVPPDELLAAIVWISAAGSAVLIPTTISRLNKVIGSDEKEPEQ